MLPRPVSSGSQLPPNLFTYLFCYVDKSPVPTLVPVSSIRSSLCAGTGQFLHHPVSPSFGQWSAYKNSSDDTGPTGVEKLQTDHCNLFPSTHPQPTGAIKQPTAQFLAVKSLSLKSQALCVRVCIHITMWRSQNNLKRVVFFQGSKSGC